ncbi:MAG: hypothetical protein ACRD5G_05135 [Candidatus Acidiferrales bacterium]
MVIALICVVSAVALAQFILLYWRATVAVVAAAPLSESIRKAAGIQGEAPAAGDFHTIMRLHEICPDLNTSAAGVDIVYLYYLTISALSRVGGAALQPWTGRELATCSRYVAACVDQRIAHNRAYLKVHVS